MAKPNLTALTGYEIMGRIGRGAGAIIYEGVELATRRRVAIKHVVRHGLRDDRFIEQAELEFEIAHSLNHAYLRKCYDIQRQRRWMKTRELFLIMEHVEGQLLENCRPTNLRGVLDVFRKVAEGLHAMHLAGFVHADIKPNNILLTSDDAIKIIDFGQSCPIGHEKERIQGTPDYMAPEQVLRQPIDQRTDVFNLGATMYWVLTDKAFKTMMPSAQVGAKKIEIEARRGNEPPHELDPNIPLPLSKLVMECCENEKNNRPRDMAKVIARIEVIAHLENRRQDEGDSDGNPRPVQPPPPVVPVELVHRYEEDDEDDNFEEIIGIHELGADTDVDVEALPIDELDVDDDLAPADDELRKGSQDHPGP